MGHARSKTTGVEPRCRGETCLARLGQQIPQQREVMWFHEAVGSLPDWNCGM
jgi:hypothetical protein